MLFDLNHELMREQVALFRARRARCASRRAGFRADARAIRRVINHRVPAQAQWQGAAR